MKIIKSLKNLSLLVGVLTLSFISVPEANAAQNATVNLTPVGDNSELAGLLLQDPNNTYTYSSPLSPTQTQITPEDTGRWYGWTLDPAAYKPCEQAVAQSVRIAARNDLQSEGSPDWSVMVLVSYNENLDIEPLTPNRPVLQGYSPDQVPFYVGRWSSDIFTYPNSEEGMGTGIEGPMEAIWSLTSLASGDQLILGVGHDAEDFTVGLQTTIESVTITYDDSGCPVAPTPSASSTTPPPSSPKTGDALSMIAATSAATAAIFLILRTAKKLKAKH
jgi:hypothetical protein